MATLLPTLLSDDEFENDNEVDEKKEKQNSKKKKDVNEEDDGGNDEDDKVEGDFEFGGLLGEDDVASSSSLIMPSSSGGVGGGNTWSYKSALALLSKNDSNGVDVERTSVASIIAAARYNLKKNKKDDDGNDNDGGDNGTEDESESDDEDKENDDSATASSSSESEESDEDADDAHKVNYEMEGDVLKVKERQKKNNKKKLQQKEQEIGEKDSNDDDDNEDMESDDDQSDQDEEAQIEAAKAAKFFDSSPSTDRNDDTQIIDNFAQLNLSRPLLRGVASMGYVSPTPIQCSVIPVALAGRDVCASAVTGSGKTAAFLLPIMERILCRYHIVPSSSSSSSNNKRNSNKAAATAALILTPTRELAAQCVSMMTSMAKFTNLTVALIVGGAKNIASQAAELRTRPDVIVATPGRLLDHLTNSQSFDLDDLEFLVLDEADRLLDLGFQEEVHEIVKSLPQQQQRQTLLFSATMNTKVDDLIKLSLKRPVRLNISNKKKHKNKVADSSSGTTDGNSSSGVEVAPRLEQEFVRVRTGNEGVNREGMLLSLLTRTFTKRTIVFFDTKVAAHRLMIICGLCGIKCAELHGNLTQTQRLEALEAFREGSVDVLLATDLAARGLDISSVECVINFEMPSQIETYVHRIGRTARAGRGGKSCTLIGEGRRYLMKQVMKDADEKSKMAKNKESAGVIRSRTIPTAVVAHFVAKINSLESHIEEVLAAEAVARMDRIAEMEAMRAKNIIEHSSEIQNRPKREWFASNQSKQLTKDAMMEKMKEIREKAGTGTHRMTRKKRRAREAKEELLRAQEEEQEERKESGLKPKKIMTDKNIKTSVRALKKQQAKSEKEKYNDSLYDEDQARKKKEKQQEKKKKRKGAFAVDSIGDSSLFDEEKVSYAKKRKTEEERKKPSSYNFTEFDPNMKKRKSGKKSVKSFKSKSKYKRR